MLFSFHESTALINNGTLPKVWPSNPENSHHFLQDHFLHFVQEQDNRSFSPPGPADSDLTAPLQKPASL